MIYFVANNGYHLYDIALHQELLGAQPVTLILVPHSIDETMIPRSVRRVVVIKRVPTEKGRLRALLYAWRLPGIVRRQIEARRGDVVFVYTEYELANQIIAGVFRKAGVPLYLIEDGGFGTYLPFRHAGSEPLSLRERVQQSYERLMPGLRKSRFHKVGGERFRAMDDALISAMLLYRNVQIKRAISQHLIVRPASLNSGLGRIDSVLFLNEPIYQHYQPFAEYQKDLVKVISTLANQFRRTYFKFHPRESDDMRLRIRAALAHIEMIEYWPTDLPVEVSVGSAAVGFACSYISTGLLNLCQRSIEPIFIYCLLPSLRDNPIFARATEVLQELGYQFPKDWSAVNPTFRSGLCDDLAADGATTLTDFLQMRGAEQSDGAFGVGA
jgi:hypothetical protein